jgi:hypothetical protein
MTQQLMTQQPMMQLPMMEQPMMQQPVMAGCCNRHTNDTAAKYYVDYVPMIYH